MADPYPPTESYEHGLLDVGDGNRVYWETRGNPHGKPAAIVHGGPGSGLEGSTGASFDRDRYRVVLRPARLRAEAAARKRPGYRHEREHHGALARRHGAIARAPRDRALAPVHGLGLDADPGLRRAASGARVGDRHPGRDHEQACPRSITCYRGVGRYFPEAWSGSERGCRRTSATATFLAAYARLTESPNADVRAKATADWLAWEDAVISQEPHGIPNAYSSRPPAAQLAFVRICAHYAAHGAWLEEGALLREAHRLAGIPGVLIHGRLDMGSPLGTAWELAQAWPDARLAVIEDSGHTGSDTMTRRFVPRSNASPAARGVPA